MTVPPLATTTMPQMCLHADGKTGIDTAVRQSGTSVWSWPVTVCFDRDATDGIALFGIGAAQPVIHQSPDLAPPMQNTDVVRQVPVQDSHKPRDLSKVPVSTGVPSFGANDPADWIGASAVDLDLYVTAQPGRLSSTEIANAHRPSVLGALGGSTLAGDDGENTLSGGDGNEHICGMGGDDQLFGGFGDDCLDGGTGHDCLDGGLGSDTLLGGEGNDTLIGGPGTDSGRDVLAGGAGDDSLTAANPIGMDGGEGDDFLNAQPNRAVAVTLEGGLGHDTLRFHPVDDTTGAMATATLDGGQGDDALWAQSNAGLLLSGGEGNDTLRGGDAGQPGAEGVQLRLEGGPGNDSLQLDSGEATLVGGEGDDTLRTDSQSSSHLDGGTGNDNLSASWRGNSTLLGGDGDDVLSATGRPLGSLVEIRLEGGRGHDLFNSSSNTRSVETLVGGAGDDTFVADIEDVVVEEANGGRDTVRILADKPSVTIAANVEVLEVSRAAGFSGTEMSVFGSAHAEEISLSGLWGTGLSRISGFGGDDTLQTDTSVTFVDGGLGNDLLIAGANSVTLDGGAGSDTLDGNGRNPVVIVDNPNDVVRNNVFGEIHTTLDYLDQLELDGAANQSLKAVYTGNGSFRAVGDSSLFRALSGGSGDDSLTGLAGASSSLMSLFGMEGDDRLTAQLRTPSGSFATLDGGIGEDRVIFLDPEVATSGVFRQRLTDIETINATNLTVGLKVDIFGTTSSGPFAFWGGSGADDIDLLSEGGRGAIARGGAGDDSLVVRDLGNPQASARLFGDAGNDTLQGSSADDWLDGGSGADLLIGGKGDDAYAVSSPGDMIVEDVAMAGGWDAVETTLSIYRLPLGVEALSFSAAGGFSGTGNPGSNMLDGAAGDDTLRGNEGDDTLNGAQGDDLLLGGSNADMLTGGLGADSLDGGNGADLMRGGPGDDTYFVDDQWDAIEESAGQGHDLVLSHLGIFVLPQEVEDLRHIAAMDFVGSGNGLDNKITGNTGKDRLEGYDGSDTLVGAAGDDHLHGGAQGDVLEGGQGNDTLNGGAGADVMRGGSGSDHYVVDDDRDQVVEDAVDQSVDTISVSLPVFSLPTAVERLAYSGTNAFHGIGNQGANTLTGGQGDDSLEGARGDDNLSGLAGADTLDGGLGRDTLVGGTGDDLYLVDETGDLVVEAADAGHDRVETSLSVFTLGPNVEDLAALSANPVSFLGNGLANQIYGGLNTDNILGGLGADTLFGRNGGDTLSGGAGRDLISGGAGPDELFGQKGDDSILGGRGSDTLVGGIGDDTLFGDDGDDLLFGGPGRDLFDGGNGQDTVSYLNSQDPVIAGLSIGFENGGAAERDRFFGIEVLVGGDRGDTLVGDDHANAVSGEDGSDRLEGGNGSDTLHGGPGNDSLLGGQGADVLIGGNGRDTADYATASKAVVVDLTGGELNGGAALGDQLQGIENLIGTQSDDWLIGDNNRNALEGGRGADHLIGGAGDDTLRGGKGADMLSGGDDGDLLEPGDGADRIDGGAGVDTVTYADAEAMVIVDLSGKTKNEGAAAGDRISNVEHLIGSDGGDILRGNQEDNEIWGSRGNDVVFGGSGKDSLFAGIGADTLIGGNGSDLLYGGPGNDSLIGGAGADTFEGGGGQDTVSYELEETGALVDLSGQVQNAGAALGDELRDVQHLVGGRGVDTLSGDDFENHLSGGAGQDNLQGGAGDDTLTGGLGADALLGARGNDLLEGGLGNDSLEGGNGADTLTGGSGHDVLVGGAGADRFVFDRNFGADIVVDFEVGPGGGDVLLFSASLGEVTDFVQFLAAVQQIDGNAIYDHGFDGKNTITLVGIEVGDLREDDVSFL